MPARFPDPPRLRRDGTSQAARSLPALDPAYAPVDERGPREWLAFTRQLARALRFHDPAQPGVELDWSGFVGEDVDLERVVAYMQDPDAATPAEVERFSRPHFALLLTFLELLGHARDQLNTLTRRHLEFYFERALGMTRSAPAPDRVNVLLQPAAGVAAHLVPSGTDLLAGTGIDGAPLRYRTDHDLIVTRATVAELRTVYAELRRTGLREARTRRDPGTNAEGRFLRMFEYALGEPGIGDPLPPFEGAPVTFATLVALGERIAFARDGLGMELYELREVMRLYDRRLADDASWAQINALLAAAGKRRDPSFQGPAPSSRAFAANLNAAVGQELSAASFAGLPEVTSVDTLYQKRLVERDGYGVAADESDVARFIREALRFPELADFDRMMALKTRDDDEWRAINRALERAGQRRRGARSYRLTPADPTAFADNFAAAIGYGDFTWPAGLASPTAYRDAIERIERRFFLSAERFAYVMSAAPGVAAATPPATTWERIYGFLEDAHKARVYARRREQLASVRQQEGLYGLLRAALGIPAELGDAAPLAQLPSFVNPGGDDSARAADVTFITSVAARDEASVTTDEWERVYRILELAQRARAQLPAPRPVRDEWRNLHAHVDATAVTASLGLGAREQERWETFGVVPPATDRATPPPENLGVAISSPLLELAEGERAITLTLGVAATGWSEAAIQAALARDPFTVRLTTAKGWIAPTKVVIVTGDYAQLSGVTRPLQAPLAALQLQLSVDVDVDPIAPLADAQLPTGDPALRVTLRQLWDEDAQQYVCAYGPLRDLELQAAHLAVDVVGLTELTLESDAGPLDPRRAFEPFGDAPSVGERLYLGHRELAVKRLDRLTLRFAWMGAPKQLAAHYANYGLGSIDNHSFTARVALIDRRRESTLVAAAPLFALEDARAPHAITIAALPEAAGHTRDASFTGALARWSRCFTCELTPRSLQHEEYPSVAAARAVALSAAIAGGQPINAAEYQVARPYTPKLRRLAVDYASSEELVLGTAAAERALSRLFHVRPFGAHQITPAADGAAHRLLPAFVDAGELYIGIAELAPPQQLTLLLQLADGSADPSLAPERVTWSYLSGDQWRSLHDGRLLADTTAGLSHSGILRFDLPAALPSTQLPAGRYWLRATIPSAPRSVCTTVAVRAQAVTATFVDEDVAPDHHAHPLPAGAITGLQTQDPAIAGVEQPYTSYGGKPRERAETFRVRVSERLRHKQRALTVWDYERLILERFPELYKVKCLPADLVDHTDAPGQVDIVVIPDIRNKLPFDPFEPKAPANLLADVEAFIGARCPTFARVRVRNASYVSVKARLGVRFRPGHDEGFYRALLNDELSRFLSPWAYDDAAEIVIGDRIYANSVINFVDRRPYVDYVADIKLFTSDDGRDYVYAQPSAQRDVEGYYVTPRRPDGVLVAARQHQIDVITELQYSAELFSGINHMKVELDFVVG